MLHIKHPSDAQEISHLGIHQLIQQRLSELHLPPEETLSEVGHFIITQTGDKAADLEKASGCHITTDPDGSNHYGTSDYAPCFEWLEHHKEKGCFELVFIMTDDGFFTVLFIPDEPDIDPLLLSFCREYS